MGITFSKSKKAKKESQVSFSNKQEEERVSKRSFSENEPFDSSKAEERHEQDVILQQKCLDKPIIKEESISTNCAALRSLKPEDKEGVIATLRGDLTRYAHYQARIVRIFTSSTFTDTFVERNYLMQHVYPNLKKYCQEHGFEFQVVDMRWGVRHEAMDDHQVLQLCVKEIENCQKVSTGPYFVSLLSEKYGYQPIPAQIKQDEFQSLVADIKDPKDIEFLHSWYELDGNNVPRVYVLQPISTRIPDYVNTVHEAARKRGIDEWNEASSSLAKILRSAADKVLLADGRRKYFASVTEIEIDKGILQNGCKRDSCFWFKRNIDNLPLVKDEVVRQYRDNDDDGDKQKAAYLANIHSRMLNEMNPKNIKEYRIQWDNEGVNPENREHSSYLSKLCKDVFELLSKRIDEAIDERSRKEVNLSVYEEVCQHIEFAKSRCEYFHGRGDELDAIHRYLKGSVNHPLVVHGESGSGKTSVLSMALECCKHWFKSDVAVVARYLGTTPDSSLLRRLLYSLSQQIAILLNQDYEAASRKQLKTLKDDFTNFLTSCKSKFSPENPLILILDSLDQLSPEDGAFQLTWLPIVLPPWVKMVISTLSKEKYDCLKKVQGLLPPQCFITISRLPLRDAVYIVDRWLMKNQRILTDQQRKMLLGAFEKCSLPIFLKVSLEEALRWKSYTKPGEIKLESNVRGAISSLFERIERQHGTVFVRHALSYITVAKNGLTESELEDVLSCDEKVLEDVYQYWVPPVRRIPPLLWLRLKHDLSSYLADRGADESMVVTWYHRQFVEAANERFLSDENEKIRMHAALADYFLGVWADGNKKPHKSRDGSIQFAERLVASQPLIFKTDHSCSHEGKQFNLRKLSELPYHLVMSNDLEVLKKECLCNYEFLLSQLRARGLSEVMDNFTLALRKWPSDKDLITVHETLQLSTNALSLWPGQLASQLMSRIQRHVIDNSECLRLLEKMTRKPSLPALVPQICCLTSPGGPLLQSLSGSSEKPSSLRLSRNGKLLVSIGEDNEILVWDAQAGRVIRNIDCPGGGTTYSCLSKNGNALVISRVGTIKSWSPSTGQPLFSIDGHDEAAPISICMVNLKEALVCYIGDTFNIVDLTSGEVIRQYATKLTRKQCDKPLKRMLTSWKSKCIVAHKDMLKSSTNFLIIEIIDADIKHSHNIVQIKTTNDIMSLEIIVQDQLLVTYAGIEEDLNKNRRPSARPSVATNWQKMSLELWDLKTMKPAKLLTSDQELVRCSCVSPDRRKIIMLCNSTFIENACEFKANIKIYSVIERESLKLSLSYPSTVIAICGIGLKCIITSSLDKIIRVWDLDRNFETGTKLQEIYGVSNESTVELNNGGSYSGNGSENNVKILVGDTDSDGSDRSRSANLNVLRLKEETDDNNISDTALHETGKSGNVVVEADIHSVTSEGSLATDKYMTETGHVKELSNNNVQKSPQITFNKEKRDSTHLSCNNEVSQLLNNSKRMALGSVARPSSNCLDNGEYLKSEFSGYRVRSPSLPVGKNYLKLSFNDLTKAVDPKLQESEHEIEDIHVQSCFGNILVFYARRVSDSVHTATVWNLDSDLKMRISGLHNPEACIVGEDGSLVVVLSSNVLSVYRSNNGDIIKSTIVDVNSDASDRLVTLQGNKVILIESGRQTAKVYSIPTLETEETISVGSKETMLRIISSEDGAYFINCLRTTRTGKSVAEIWRSKDLCKQYKFEYRELQSEFTDTQILNDGKMLTDLAFDKKDNRYQLIIWKAETSETIYITPPNYSINLYKLSSDFKTMIMGTWTGDLLSYEIEESAIRHLTRAHSGPVHQILLSKSGDKALSIAGAFNSRDRSVRLWNRRTGKMITEYTPDVKISSILATKDFRYVVLEIQGKLVKFELLQDSECY